MGVWNFKEVPHRRIDSVDLLLFKMRFRSLRRVNIVQLKCIFIGFNYTNMLKFRES